MIFILEEYSTYMKGRLIFYYLLVILVMLILLITTSRKAIFLYMIDIRLQIIYGFEYEFENGLTLIAILLALCSIFTTT